MLLIIVLRTFMRLKKYLGIFLIFNFILVLIIMVSKIWFACLHKIKFSLFLNETITDGIET